MSHLQPRPGEARQPGGLDHRGQAVAQQRVAEDAVHSLVTNVITVLLLLIAMNYFRYKYL